MPMNHRLLVPRQTTHPEALAWRAAVIANGGSVSGTTLTAVDRFVRSIYAAGIRDRFYRLNLFCGTGLSACLVPLFRGPSFGGATFGNATDTNNNFVSGDYTSTGLIGNGTTKFLSTGLLNSDLPQNNAHLSAYEHTRATTTFDTSIGSRETNTTGVLLLGSWSVVANYVFSGFESGSVVTDSSGTGGHFIGSVTGAAASAIYKNGALSQDNTGTTRTPTAREITVFCLNTGGTNGQFTNARLAGYSAGLGLTAAQALSFSNAMTEFQTALGRNV